MKSPYRQLLMTVVLGSLGFGLPPSAARQWQDTEPADRTQPDASRSVPTLTTAGTTELAGAPTAMSSPPLSTGQETPHRGCTGDLDMPLTIDLSTDSTKLAKGATAEVHGALTAHVALSDIRVRVRAEGYGTITRPVRLDHDLLASGQTVDFAIPVRFDDDGITQVIVDVTAVISETRFPFGKQAVFNVLLRPEQVITGRDVPRHLRIRAVREDLRAGRINRETADTQIKALTRLEGSFDQNPYDVIDRTPQEHARVDGLAPAITESVNPDKRPSALGGVNLRVRGLVQWRDENNVNHPVYGMTVQVRDDDTTGSELVRLMATDANGQYDTGWFNHDDGWLAGNPDIFVRFRTENTAIDVEDGCFLCGTYESDSQIHDEFPGGEIVENFTCANTGTGPACSVLTGLTWIALYAHNLNNGNWVSKIRADWPGDSGSSNYNCTPACRLNIQPGDKWDWDVLHHEYGHWVMDEFNFEDSPGGTHYVDACHAISQGNKDDGMKLAWSEGWPTFFGTSGQLDLNMASLNVPRVGDVLYSETEEDVFDYSLEANSGGIVPTGSYTGRGEDSELAVQRVLWDLHDTASDSRDTVSVSVKSLFDIFKNTGPHSLNAAWAAIRATLSNADDLAYGGVLTDHLIGPTPLSPSEGMIVTEGHASFFWDANVGCDPSYAGDSFDLVFYNAANFNRILTIPRLTGTFYALTPAEFQTVARQAQSVIWAVEARNSRDPATGPYLGAGVPIEFYLPPDNDACASAQPITNVTIHGTTFGATQDGQTSCNVIATPDVWYSYQATCDGFLSVDTCGSTFDTIVSVYDACPGTYQNEIECNRTCGGIPCGGTDACIGGSQVPVSQGQVYLIRVGGWVQEQGDFTLNVSCTAQADACDAATNVAINSTTPGSTVGAAIDVAPTCGDVTVDSPGVWYTVYGNGNKLRASLCNAGTEFDTKLSVYCSGCSSPWCRGANDDACGGTKSQIEWCSTPGAVHHILVHGYNGATGDFQLEVTDTGEYCGPFYFSCVPPNNTCATALDVATNFVGDNTGTTTSGSASCASSVNDVWYRYTPNCTGFLVISTCGPNGSLADTVLSVYDECNGREIGCNDDGGDPACGLRSSLTIPVIADRSLLVRVAAYHNAAVTEGTFPLSFSMNGTIAPLSLHWPGLYFGEGEYGYEDYLFRLGIDPPAYVDVGPLGVSGLSGLAYAPTLGLMYGINDKPDADEMVTVDLATGAATVFGNVGFAGIQALAFDSRTSSLYGADLVTGQLVRINPFTGVGTGVGPLGFAGVMGLAFDPHTNTLYGADTATDQLIRIDTVTGFGTAIGPFGAGLDDIKGLTFDSVAGVLFGMTNDGNGGGRLLQINTDTGHATGEDVVYASSDPNAMAFVPGLPGATVGKPFNAPLPVAGGCPRYLFANATGLPQGLAISAGGSVVGTPTQNGLFNFTVDVGDSNLGSSDITRSLPLRVRPANDECPDALPVESGATPFDSAGATTDGPDEPTRCDYSGNTQVDADVWFCHEAACTGDLTVSLCESNYDTKMAVYPGCTCPTREAAIACNDDWCGASGLQSEITIPVTAGQSYLIRVGGYSGSTGSGTLSITCTECTVDADCDDGNLCTDDVCRNGRCEAVYKSCDDGDLCTIDDCSPSTGCVNAPIVCDDRNACTTGSCNPMTGACEMTPISCDDGDPCTVDSCDPVTGCVNDPSGTPNTDCDGNGIEDACDLAGGAPDCNANGILDACDRPGDADGDGLISLADYGLLFDCITGPCTTGTCSPPLYVSPCCVVVDADADGDVDAQDFAAFQASFGTPAP